MCQYIVTFYIVCTFFYIPLTNVNETIYIYWDIAIERLNCYMDLHLPPYVLPELCYDLVRFFS